MKIGDKVCELNSNISFATIIDIEEYLDDELVYVLRYDNNGVIGYWLGKDCIKKYE